MKEDNSDGALVKQTGWGLSYKLETPSAIPVASFSITINKGDEGGMCIVEAKCVRRVAEDMGKLWDDWYIERERDASYVAACDEREKNERTGS